MSSGPSNSISTQRLILKPLNLQKYDRIDLYLQGSIGSHMLDKLEFKFWSDADPDHLRAWMNLDLSSMTIADSPHVTVNDKVLYGPNHRFDPEIFFLWMKHTVELELSRPKNHAMAVELLEIIEAMPSHGLQSKNTNADIFTVIYSGTNIYKSLKPWYKFSVLAFLAAVWVAGFLVYGILRGQENRPNTLIPA